MPEARIYFTPGQDIESRRDAIQVKLHELKIANENAYRITSGMLEKKGRDSIDYAYDCDLAEADSILIKYDL